MIVNNKKKQRMNCDFPLIVQLNYPFLRCLQSRQEHNEKPNQCGFSKQLWNHHALEIFYLLKDINVRKQNNCLHKIFSCASWLGNYLKFININYVNLKKRFTTLELSLLFQQKTPYYNETVIHILDLHNILDLNEVIQEDLLSLSNLYQKNKAGYTSFQSVLLTRNIIQYKKQSINLFLKFNYQITKEDLSCAHTACNYEIESFLKKKYKQQKLRECWLIWSFKYKSLVQWLPRELVDDLVLMIKRKKSKRYYWNKYADNVHIYYL